MKKNSKYSFELDNDKLNESRHLTPQEKLKWLYEVNLFLQKVLTKKQKKTWDKIRKGKF